MRNLDNVTRTGRRWHQGLAVALVGVLTVGAAGTALAHDDDWKEWKRHRHNKPYVVVTPPVRYYVPPPVVYSPPVVYAPPPVVVYPEPVMSYPQGGSVNLGVTLPLR